MTRRSRVRSPYGPSYFSFFHHVDNLTVNQIFKKYFASRLGLTILSSVTHLSFEDFPLHEGARVFVAAPLFLPAVIGAHGVIYCELEDGLLFLRDVVEAAVVPLFLVLVSVTIVILLLVVQFAGTGACFPAHCLSLTWGTEVRTVESVAHVILRVRGVLFAPAHAPQLVFCG